MKVGEFFDQLKELMERHEGSWRHVKDMDVVVRLNNSSVGPCATTSVEGFHMGIDWDRNSFFLKTDRPIYHAKPVSREEMKSKGQTTLGHLEKLDYLPKQRKHCWLDGYKHGFDVGVQSRFSETHPPEPSEVIEQEL